MNYSGITVRSFLYFFLCGVCIHYFNHHWSYILFVILMGMIILRHFCLMHELGHENMFKNRNLNDAFGFFSSFISATPYYSWKYIHREHHIWAGYRDLDPTEDDLEFSSLRPVERAFANLCWKLWLPLLSMSFSIRTFYNFKKVKPFTRNGQEKNKVIFGILFMIFGHILLMFVFGKAYFIYYGAGLIVFLFFMDPVAISQHVGIHQNHSQGQKVLPFKTLEQNQFARTLILPYWMGRYVLLGFNLHSIHHSFPRLPGHLSFNKEDFKSVHEENGWKWLMESKKKSLEVLLSHK